MDNKNFEYKWVIASFIIIGSIILWIVLSVNILLYLEIKSEQNQKLQEIETTLNQIINN